MNISPSKVKMFKLRNRRGYAAVCLNHLTEGNTPYLAYQRMVKALRRSGGTLKDIPVDKIKRLVS